MLDGGLFGLKPAGHHLHNLALHVLATGLLFWVLHSMTGAVWRSAFVAMAFGIHPVHVESVAWASERKDVLCVLGMVLQKQSRMDDASIQFRTALKIKPEDGGTWSSLGDCYAAQGMLQDAIDSYNHSLKLKPNEAATYYKLGEAAKQQGRVEAAVAHHRKALEIKPDFSPSLNNLAWILATNKDSQTRNPSEAVRLAEAACEATSFKDQNCLDTLAAAYAGAGQFDKAVETARKAISVAQANGDNDSVQDISKKLGLHQTQQPYREP
jgi:tetratricopeptide (TPR) repeat protein